MPEIAINGRSIAYDCPVPLERDQGRRLLFVHGASFHRQVWTEQMAYFAPTETPVCLDLAGHGQSQGPVCATVEEHQAIVKAFADGIGLTDFILVGHSMGGAIAQAYVAREPNDVWALVLVSTAPRFNIPEELLAEWGSAPDAYREQEIDMILAPMTDQPIRQRLLAMRDANAPDVQHADLIACSRWHNVEGFAEIRQPTLLITGAYDSLCEENHVMHAQLPGAQLVVLGRSGHMMMVEEPDVVNRAIADFVRQVP